MSNQINKTNPSTVVHREGGCSVQLHLCVELLLLRGSHSLPHCFVFSSPLTDRWPDMIISIPLHPLRTARPTTKRPARRARSPTSVVKCLTIFRFPGAQAAGRWMDVGKRKPIVLSEPAGKRYINDGRVWVDQKLYNAFLLTTNVTGKRTQRKKTISFYLLCFRNLLKK